MKPQTKYSASEDGRKQHDLNAPTQLNRQNSGFVFCISNANIHVCDFLARFQIKLRGFPICAHVEHTPDPQVKLVIVDHKVAIVCTEE